MAANVSNPDATPPAVALLPPSSAAASPAAPPGNTNGGELSKAEPKPFLKPQWTRLHSLGLLLLLLVVGLVDVTSSLLMAYLVNLVLLTASLLLIGHGILGMWCGVLIDERNKLSLSRFQMAGWTIVVLSGFLAAALANVSHGDSNPLVIQIPQQLWLLMGISTTSLAASPLILSTKKVEPAGSGEATQQKLNIAKELLARQGVPPQTVANQGKVVVWRWPSDARLADLFQGEEIGNAANLDLGKVQMFYFTLILLVTYGVTLARAFVAAAPAGIHSFPGLDESMVALLGISHAGYLTNKAIPHTPD